MYNDSYGPRVSDTCMTANRRYIGTEGPLRLPFDLGGVSSIAGNQALQALNRKPARLHMSCTTSHAVYSVEMRNRSTARCCVSCLCEAATHQRAWPQLSCTSKLRVLLLEPLALLSALSALSLPLPTNV